MKSTALFLFAAITTSAFAQESLPVPQPEVDGPALTAPQVQDGQRSILKRSAPPATVPAVPAPAPTVVKPVAPIQEAIPAQQVVPVSFRPINRQFGNQMTREMRTSAGILRGLFRLPRYQQKRAMQLADSVYRLADQLDQDIRRGVHPQTIGQKIIELDCRVSELRAEVDFRQLVYEEELIPKSMYQIESRRDGLTDALGMRAVNTVKY